MALVGLAMAANTVAFGLSWSAVEHHIAIELNPSARFSIPSLFFNFLGIGFLAIWVSREAPTTRNIIIGGVLGGLAADATWDFTQFLPSIFGSTAFCPFVTTLFVASMTPAGIALLEVKRLIRQYENLSRR